MQLGNHHQHLRKRIYQHLEPYPHPDALKRFMDRFIFVIGLLGPVMTIPQVTLIWVHKNAVGVSAVAWISYTVFSIFWIVYGVFHKEKPIIFTYILWFIMSGLVAAGALVYGR